MIQNDAILKVKGLASTANPIELTPADGYHTVIKGGAIGSLWADTRTTGALSSDYSQFRLFRAGVAKWRHGCNLDGSGNDKWSLYSDVAGAAAITVHPTTKIADFAVAPTIAGVAISTGAAIPFDLTGSTTSPIATWYNSNSAGSGLKLRIAASTRFNNQYSLMVANGANTSRAFQVWGDESIVQIGPTPGSVQWPATGGTTAPGGSGGPAAGFSPSGGMLFFNGPTSGDSQIHMIANADLTGASATGGPSQQQIGLVGTNSVGRMRMSFWGASSDGGVRFFGNRYPAPERTATGTVARTALDTLTFSSSGTLAQVEIGENVWVNLSGTIYGYTLRDKPTSTTATIPSIDSGREDGASTPGTFTAKSFTIRGNPQADTNRGSLQYGTDSANNVFGLRYSQPKDQTTYQPFFATVSSYIKDFHFLIYPGGFDDGTNARGMSFGRFTDMGTNGAGRGLRLFVSSETANDTTVPSMTFYPHHGLGGGPIEVHGDMRLQGNIGGERAPLQVQHQSSAPTAPLDGDVWTTTAGMFCRINGVNKTVTLT